MVELEEIEGLDEIVNSIDWKNMKDGAYFINVKNEDGDRKVNVVDMN